MLPTPLYERRSNREAPLDQLINKVTQWGPITIGKASVAHVLTMLGGPMERMESWGPPGRNKRRPCKVKVSLGDTVKTLLPGSVENWRATSRAQGRATD